LLRSASLNADLIVNPGALARIKIEDVEVGASRKQALKRLALKSFDLAAGNGASDCG
jgi:hypothetical protein